MNPNRAREIFLELLANVPPTEWDQRLAVLAGADEELRAKVAALLAAHRKADDFLEAPAVPLGGTVDEPPAGAANLDERGAEPGSEEASGHVLNGRYKLLEPIGEGGMGTVWMAQQIEPIKRLVAVKLVKAGMDSKQVLARFEAERQALALMDHPNIAKVLDAGSTGKPGCVSAGRPYFVMELVKGVPIARYCDEHRLTPRQRLELVVPVCHAIQHAHQKGIIHRDLKPSNVLVALFDDRPVPKVIDFGVAKATGQQLTEQTLHTGFGAVVGTIEYMSPEQATFNQLDVDTRSDVYSLGVLLYELLTGSPPFSRKDLEKAGVLEMMRLIREQEPPRPSTKLSTAEGLPSLAAQRGTEPKRLTALVRGELDWIVMKALEKDRSRRYETANSFAMDLQRYLADEPVQACPPSATYRLRKFARKHRALLLTGSTFAVLLLIATALSLGLALWATRAEADAQTKRHEAETAGKQLAMERDTANEERARTRRALERMTVTEGLRRAAEGNLFGALPFLVRPLELGGLTPDEEKIHRTRIACFLRHTPGRPTLRQMLFHDGPVDFTAWSPDARRLLAVREKVVHVWDIRTGNSIATLTHPDKVTQAQFTGDSASVMTLAGRSVWTWDVATGRPTRTPFVAVETLPEFAYLSLPRSTSQALSMLAVKKAVDDHYFRIAMSPDSTRILVQSGAANRVYEVSTWRKISEWSWQWRGQTLHVGQFDSSARRVLLQEDRKACVFDTDTGVAVGPVTALPHDSYSVQFLLDGQRLLSVDEDGIRFWDARTGKPSSEPTRLAEYMWDNPPVSPDSRFVAFKSSYERETGSVSASIWDIEGGRVIGDRLVHQASIDHIAFRGDGRQVLTVSHDGICKRWWTATGKPTGPCLEFRGVEIWASLSPDGRLQAAADKAGVVRIYDLVCGQFQVVGWRQVLDLTPAIDHNYLPIRGERGISSSNHLLPRMDAPRVRDRLSILPFEIRQDCITAAISPNNRYLITTRRSHDGLAGDMAQLWDATTGRPISQPLTRESSLLHAEFSPDSRLVVTTTSSGTILWETRTGRSISPPLRHGSRATFSPDNTLLVTCGSGNVAKVWRTADGQQIGRELVHTNRVCRAAFSPDGRQVATCSFDRSARIWDAISGEPRSPPLIHQGPVYGVAFSPDGRLLLTTGVKEALRLWDATTSLEISPPIGSSGPNYDRFYDLRFAADGRRITYYGSVASHYLEGVFDIAPDTRTANDLTRLAQLLSGLRLDAQDGSVSLTKEELRALWTELYAKYPDEFAVSADAVLDWRVNELQGLDGIKDAHAVAFHNRWLARELTEAGWVPGPPPDARERIDAWLYRLYALARHGRHAEASTAADALAVRWPKDTTLLYNGACVHALAAGAVADNAALAEQYGARAVALLNQAVAAGYKDGEHLRQDPDLVALRQRQDFSQLLSRLSKPP